MAFAATDADESQGQVSPDGKWMACVSNETGDYEVYIRPFPEGPRVWRVSLDRGLEPRWSADGRQLYFLRPVGFTRGTLQEARVDDDGRGGLRTGTPQPLFDSRSARLVPRVNWWSYSPAPDGQRFLVSVAAEEGETTINLITNWQQALSGRKAP